MNNYTSSGISFTFNIENIPDRVYSIFMSISTSFSALLKDERKRNGLTQEDLALRSGVGLRFIRDVEQGKASVRLDTLNRVLALFGYEAGPIRRRENA